MSEREQILRAERVWRFIAGGCCPDCDDVCESWDEDGVSCGYAVGESVTPAEAREVQSRARPGEGGV